RRVARRGARLALAGRRRSESGGGRAHHPHGAGLERRRSARAVRVRQRERQPADRGVGERAARSGAPPGAGQGAAVMTTARTPILSLALAMVAAPRAGARTLDRRAAVHAALAQNPRVAAARAEEAVLEAQ